eukprot:5013248-Pyramimonas_sp.AAC.1
MDLLSSKRAHSVPLGKQRRAGPTQPCAPVQRSCNCTFKTALAPAGHQELWRALVEHAPFGGPSVRGQWPYLGAVVVSRAAEGEELPLNGGLT